MFIAHSLFYQDGDPRSALPFEVWAAWPVAHLLFCAIHFPLPSSRELCRGERVDRLLDEPQNVHWGQGKSGSASPGGVGRREDAGWGRDWAQWDAEHTQLSAEVGCLAGLLRTTGFAVKCTEQSYCGVSFCSFWVGIIQPVRNLCLSC